MIYQIHEKHGKHMAQTQLEAESNEKNGWKTVSEAEFYGGLPKEKAIARELMDEVLDSVRDQWAKEYEEMFGKKPHHKMKPETIKEKIDAGHS